MATKYKPIARIMLVLMILTLFIPVAFADEGNSINIIVPHADRDIFKKQVWDKLSGTGEDGAESKLKLDFKTTNDVSGLKDQMFEYDDSGGKLKFYSDSFNLATEKSKKKALGNFVTTMQESGVNMQTQQNIFDSLNGINTDVSKMLIPLLLDNTKADLFTALKIVNPIMPTVSTVIGVVVICVVFILMFSTVFDLVFIGLPIAREMTTNSDGKTTFLISSDAVAVVKETESSLDAGGRYKNPYMIYFMRRSVTLVILAICILYLVLGQIGDIISWLLNIGSGFAG